METFCRNVFPQTRRKQLAQELERFTACVLVFVLCQTVVCRNVLFANYPDFLLLFLYPWLFVIGLVLVINRFSPNHESRLK